MTKWELEKDAAWGQRIRCLAVFGDGSVVEEEPHTLGGSKKQSESFTKEEYRQHKKIIIFEHEQNGIPGNWQENGTDSYEIKDDEIIISTNDLAYDDSHKNLFLTVTGENVTFSRP